MKKTAAKGIVLFMMAAALAGCSGDKKTIGEPEPKTEASGSLFTLSQVELPVSIQGSEFIVGQTTIQEILDDGFELMVSEWDGNDIIQHELDPNDLLRAGTKNTEISFWITNASFARLSIAAKTEDVRTGDASITRLELHLSNEAEKLPSDILIDGVPVTELTRTRAGEMFPDFEQDSLSVTQRGEDYECALMFNPQTLKLYHFTLRDTWGDAPEPEIKVPSI